MHAATLPVVFAVAMAKLLILAAVMLQERLLVVVHACWLAHTLMVLRHRLTVLVLAHAHLSTIAWHLT